MLRKPRNEVPRPRRRSGRRRHGIAVGCGKARGTADAPVRIVLPGYAQGSSQGSDRGTCSNRKVRRCRPRTPQHTRAGSDAGAICSFYSRTDRDQDNTRETKSAKNPHRYGRARASHIHTPAPAAGNTATNCARGAPKEERGRGSSQGWRRAATPPPRPPLQQGSAGPCAGCCRSACRGRSCSRRACSGKSSPISSPEHRHKRLHQHKGGCGSSSRDSTDTTNTPNNTRTNDTFTFVYD